MKNIEDLWTIRVNFPAGLLQSDRTSVVRSFETKEEMLEWLEFLTNFFNYPLSSAYDHPVIRLAGEPHVARDGPHDRWS